jgi:hypothetical protein
VQVAARTQPEREWWLRTLLVLQAPTAVFAALRNEGDEDVAARSEPLVAIGFLAGIAAVLSSSLARHALDSFTGGITTVAAWVVFTGALYGLFGVWLVGLLVHLASRRLGSQGSYRRARHVVGFALTPLALSLILLWPVRLALYGEDGLRRGGDDAGTTANGVLDWLTVAAGLWALALLLVGIRAVHAWTWGRTAAAFGLAAALPALVVALTAFG